MVDSPNVIEPQGSPAPPADRVDLSKLLAAMRRQKWVVAIAALIGLVFGIAYLATTPRSYFAATTVMLDANVNRSVDEVSVIEGGTGDSALEGAIQIIRSQQLAVQVVERLQLDENQVFLNPPVSLFARGLGYAMGVLRLPLALMRGSENAAGGATAAPPPPEVLTQLRRNAVGALLRGRLVVGREGRSAVISIGYVSHDPALTAAIANAYAEAYAADVLNANFEATERTTEWLRSRLDELQENAFDAAMVAEAFRIENGLVSSRTSGGLMSEQNAAQLNNELATAMAEVARAQALLGSYESIIAEGAAALAEPGRAGGFGGGADSRLTEMQGQLSALNARLRQIETEFGADHPQAQAVRTQIARLAETLFAEIGRLRDDASGALDMAQARVNALRESLGLAVDASSAEGSAQVRLRALEQQARTLETLYQSFLSRFEEIEQQKSFPISNVRVLSAAEVPRAAFGPRTLRTLALMVVLGGIIGCVIGLWREWRDWFFRTGESIEEETGQRFLGYLPRLPQIEGAPPARPEGGARARPLPETGDIPLVQRPLFALQNPRSLFTETLQNVRFTSDMLLAGKSSRIIGLTSILPSEGKTTVALNLAGLTAASGAETLLIDCDPRNPGLSRDLRHLRGTGLVEAITGQIPWQSALRAVGETGLHILPCVAPPYMTHVGDLLNSPQMQRILEEARQRYSHIVLDLPPLGPVVDARMLLPQVDQALMVVEWGKTPRSLVRKAIARDPVLAGRIMGIVLNKTDMERLKAYSPETDAEHHYGEYGGYLAN